MSEIAQQVGIEQDQFIMKLVVSEKSNYRTAVGSPPEHFSLQITRSRAMLCEGEGIIEYNHHTCFYHSEETGSAAAPIPVTFTYYTIPYEKCGSDVFTLRNQSRIFIDGFPHTAFGNSNTFHTPTEGVWSDSKITDPLYSHAQIYALQSVPHHPTVYVSGHLWPNVTRHTRASSEGALIMWKLVFSEESVEGPGRILDSGMFIIKQGKIAQGKNSVGGFYVTGFTGMSTLSVWIRHSHRYERPNGGHLGVVDDLTFWFLSEMESSKRSYANVSSPPSPSAVEVSTSLDDILGIPKPAIHQCLIQRPAAVLDELHNSMKGYTMWSNDFHAAPVMCNMFALEHIGIHYKAQVDFNNCEYWPHICKRDLKVLSFADWRGFSLDPCPSTMRRKFFEAYQHDRKMQRVDGYICSHPAANCELFIPFNKSIIIHATTRLEFGRNDDVVDWRRPYMSERSPERWKEWVANLQKIGSDSRNTIAANNFFDANYIKYHAGISAQYIPSFCSYVRSAIYKPTRPQYLLGPYRDNLGFKISDRRRHPIMQEFWRLVNGRNEERTKQLEFRYIAELYPGRYEYQDLASHPAIINIPYQLSVMSWFEFYQMAIPLFFPSLRLLVQWQQEYGVTWERVYGHPEELIVPHTLFSPNSDDCPDVLYWFQFADFYVWPHVLLFDSWEHLLHLLETTDLEEVSRRMEEYNQCLQAETVQKWKSVMSRAVGNNAPGAQPIPQTNFNHTLNALGFPPASADTDWSCL